MPDPIAMVLPVRTAQVFRPARRSMTVVIQLSDNPAAPAQNSGKNPLFFAENRIFATSLL
jgi:hypothetical protein